MGETLLGFFDVFDAIFTIRDALQGDSLALGFLAIDLALPIIGDAIMNIRRAVNALPTISDTMQAFMRGTDDVTNTIDRAASIRNRRTWYDYDPRREWQYPDLHPDANSRLPSWFVPSDNMRGTRGGPRYLTVDGKMVRNYEFRGQNYRFAGDLDELYPLGVDFDQYGFPIFDPYVIQHPTTGEPIILEIHVSGSGDANKAEREAAIRGLNPDFDVADRSTWLSRQLDGRWHHVQDANTMQLVISIVHETVGHSGGAEMRRHLINQIIDKK